eukprot:161628_1
MATLHYTQSTTSVRETGKPGSVSFGAVARYNYAMHCFKCTHRENNNLDKYKGRQLMLTTYYYNDIKRKWEYDTRIGRIFYNCDWIISFCFIGIFLLTLRWSFLMTEWKSTFFTIEPAPIAEALTSYYEGIVKEMSKFDYSNETWISIVGVIFNGIHIFAVVSFQYYMAAVYFVLCNFYILLMSSCSSEEDLSKCIISCNNNYDLCNSTNINGCSTDEYDIFMRNMRYITFMALFSSLILWYFYFRFLITIYYNHKNIQNIQALSCCVENHTISQIYETKNIFLEVTQQHIGGLEVANLFVDKNKQEWCSLFGVEFEQKQKYTILLWEERWGRQYYSNSRDSIVFSALMYTVMFVLSFERFIEWWLIQGNSAHTDVHQFQTSEKNVETGLIGEGTNFTAIFLAILCACVGNFVFIWVCGQCLQETVDESEQLEDGTSDITNKNNINNNKRSETPHLKHKKLIVPPPTVYPPLPPTKIESQTKLEKGKIEKDNIVNENNILSEAENKWKFTKMSKWNNTDVLNWINSMNVTQQCKQKLLYEIEKSECIGKDIKSLKSAQEIGDAFSVSDNEQLCNDICQRIVNFKPEKPEIENVESNVVFTVNIFSQNKHIILEEQVTKDDSIQYIKTLYKIQCGIAANIEDIHMYYKRQLLLPESTLGQNNILNEKHLITVKFAVDGTI